MNNVLPLEGFKVMIQSPVLVDDCKENRVTHIFELRDNVLEYITVFEAG